MRKLFMVALISPGLPIDAAWARVIVLKGTHTWGQVEIACTKADGVSTAGRGHGGFGCKTSKGEVECNAAGECIGNNAEPGARPRSRLAGRIGKICS